LFYCFIVLLVLKYIIHQQLSSQAITSTIPQEARVFVLQD